MFQIEYSTSNNLKEEKVLESDEIALRYNLFLGSVILKSKTSKINLDWEWIPLLDFAYSLIFICDNLSENNLLREVFEFTESEGVLVFEMKGKLVEITTSFSNEKLTSDINEFKKGSYFFYSELMGQIKSNNEKITENPNFKTYEDTLNDVSV